MSDLDSLDSSAQTSSSSPLLEIRDLSIGFRSPGGGEVVEAVKNVSYSIGNGKGLAVVGESGSGKSVTALSLAGLLPMPPAQITGGEILFRGEDTLKMSERRLRKLRGKEIAYVFQEPSTSLNPVFSIRSQLGEMLALHRPDIDRSERDAEMIRWLYKVGIVDPEKRLGDYPHQLSGGMQQRVMIAMALCARPSLLVADEPTTALDVTIQSQIMELLADLKEELGMSLLLITHNFGIIRRVAERVAVMYRGDIVEEGPVEQVMEDPQHPYTKALIACVPRMGANLDRLPTIESFVDETA